MKLLGGYCLFVVCINATVLQTCNISISRALYCIVQHIYSRRALDCLKGLFFITLCLGFISFIQLMVRRYCVKVHIFWSRENTEKERKHSNLEHDTIQGRLSVKDKKIDQRCRRWISITD